MFPEGCVSGPGHVLSILPLSELRAVIGTWRGGAVLRPTDGVASVLSVVLGRQAPPASPWSVWPRDTSVVPHREVLSSHHRGKEMGPGRLLCPGHTVIYGHCVLLIASSVVVPSLHLLVSYLEGPVVGRCALRHMCAENDDRFIIFASPPNFCFEPPLSTRIIGTQFLSVQGSESLL